MKRFLERLRSGLPSTIDRLDPLDTVQLILKKKGEPVAGIYKDNDREIRSPSLQDQDEDASTAHNS